MRCILSSREVNTFDAGWFPRAKCHVHRHEYIWGNGLVCLAGECNKWVADDSPAAGQRINVSMPKEHWQQPNATLTGCSSSLGGACVEQFSGSARMLGERRVVSSN